MVNYNKLGDLSKEKGLSQSYISTKIGMSRNYIKDCKRQNISIPSDRLIQIANILDTSVDYLTDKTDKKEKPTEYDGLSEKQKVIMDFVMSVPDDKAEMILRVMKSILESDK